MEWLAHDEDFESNFFCECGCCEPVRLTVARYDALAGEPVYLAGHTVLEKRYGVTIRQSDG